MAAEFGIALGGGGVRGLANLGVIQALHEAGLMPTVIGGTSMGAIVAGVYADNLNARLTENLIRDFILSEDFQDQASRLSSAASEFDKGFYERLMVKARKGYFFYRFLLRQSLISPEAFFLGLDALIPDMELADLKIPFACTALNLTTGRQENFTSGSLRDVVKASSAVPGVLPPVSINGSLYVDGGWVEVVPVSAVRELGADFVVGVNVTKPIAAIDCDSEINSSMDIMTRADDIARSIMNSCRMATADFMIKPEVAASEWWDFDQLDACIEAGYAAGVQAAPELKKALRWYRRLPWSRGWR